MKQQKPATTHAKATGVNPRPLVMVLIAVAFMGGSCSLYDLSMNYEQVPTRDEVEQILKARETQLPEGELRMSPEAVDRLYVVFVDVLGILNGYRKFEVPLSMLLLGLYTAVAASGLRTLRFRPHAARQLSLVAVMVLPFRVAAAAIDLAADQHMLPVIRQGLNEVAELAGTGMPEGADAASLQEAMRAVGGAFEFGVLGWNAASALFIGALLTFAWRYFQREDVVAFYEARTKPAGV